MGRGKIQLKLIEKRSLRKSMYLKRFGSLKKKAYELSKLCDVPVMVISVELEGTVDTYPGNEEEVSAILKKYKLTSNKAPEKNKLNSEKVIQSQILKKQLELDQLKKNNENMLSAALNYLDFMLMEVHRMSYLKMPNDMNELQIDTQMSTEESAKHDNVSNLFEAEIFSFDNLFNGSGSHSPLVEKSADCHELGDLQVLLEATEFSIEELPEGNDFDYLADYMNELQFDTQMSTEESAEQDNVSNLFEAATFSFDNLFNGSGSHPPLVEKSADCHEHGDLPVLLEAAEFSVEELFEGNYSDYPADYMNDELCFRLRNC